MSVPAPHGSGTGGGTSAGTAAAYAGTGGAYLTGWKAIPHATTDRERLEQAAAVARRNFRDLNQPAQLERLLDLMIRQGDILMTALDDARAMIAQVAVEANEAANRITALIEAAEAGADEHELRSLISDLTPVRDRLAAVTPSTPDPEPQPEPEPFPEEPAPVDPNVPVDPNAPAPPPVPPVTDASGNPVNPADPSGGQV